MDIFRDEELATLTNEKEIKKTYPKPKTSEFLVMARYNNIVESIFEKYVKNFVKFII